MRSLLAALFSSRYSSIIFGFLFLSLAHVENSEISLGAPVALSAVQLFGSIGIEYLFVRATSGTVGFSGLWRTIASGDIAEQHILIHDILF